MTPEAKSPAPAPARKPDPILRLLTLISDAFDWLNYQTFYDARYQLIDPLKPAWKNIAYTPYPQIANSTPTGRTYFHRATLHGCGCGYDGVWIYPQQCSWLYGELVNNTYRGF